MKMKMIPNSLENCSGDKKKKSLCSPKSDSHRPTMPFSKSHQKFTNKN